MLYRSGISDHMSGLSRLFARVSFLRVLLGSSANGLGLLALITACCMLLGLNIGIPFILTVSLPIQFDCIVPCSSIASLCCCIIVLFLFLIGGRAEADVTIEVLCKVSVGLCSLVCCRFGTLYVSYTQCRDRWVVL